MRMHVERSKSKKKPGAIHTSSSLLGTDHIFYRKQHKHYISVVNLFLNIYSCTKGIDNLHIFVGSLHLFSTHVYEHLFKHNKGSF